MTLMEIFGLVTFYLLLLVIPIGNYLGDRQDEKEANELITVIETLNAETGI